MTIRRLLLQRFTRLVADPWGARADVQERFLTETREQLVALLCIGNSLTVRGDYLSPKFPHRGTLEERQEFDLWWKNFEHDCKAIAEKNKK